EGRGGWGERLAQIDRVVAQLAEPRGCRQIEPLVGLDLVDNDALTEQVADADIVERVRVILLRAAKEPDQRRRVVARHVAMTEIHFADGTRGVRDARGPGALERVLPQLPPHRPV